jgi:hypothetical protein
VFQTLRSFFKRRDDAAQLDLGLELQVPRNADELLARLRILGLQSIRRARLTRNRNVMVSFGNGELRVHEGYLAAPEPMHRAIVAFVEGRTRAERRAAQKVIVAHPVGVSTAPPRKPQRTHDDDATIQRQLLDWHERYNARHFHGRLKPVAIRVSRRMKSRLGHYSAASPTGEAAEIAISRAHLRRHGWTETLHTLLHEMVHQWQDETGRPIDHGSQFRAKSREVGIAPYARRVLTRDVRQGATTLGRRAAREG